jgi:hypothetical protein
MNKLIAILSFALSLYGCDVGGNTTIHRSSADGSDVLYSKVVARPGLSRFECLTSASGHCYYTLYARECAPAPGSQPAPGGKPDRRCQPRAVERFVLASGESRQVAALSRYRMCVSTDADAAIPGCEPPEPLAAR